MEYSRIKNFLKNVPKLLEKFCKKVLAQKEFFVYSRLCCGMIAVKREVAACEKSSVGFPWSECQGVKNPKKLTTSHCTNVE